MFINFFATPFLICNKKVQSTTKLYGTNDMPMLFLLKTYFNMFPHVTIMDVLTDKKVFKFSNKFS
jgi:hypothetical protein